MRVQHFTTRDQFTRAPHGRRCALATDGGVWVMDLDEARVVTLIPTARDVAGMLLPDDDTLVVLTRDGVLSRYALPDGGCTHAQMFLGAWAILGHAPQRVVLAGAANLGDSLDMLFHVIALPSFESTDIAAERFTEAMRAVLTSARSRPCIDQDVIPAKTNEMGHFPTFWKALRRAYSRADLFALVTLDAGYSSKQNAKIIDDDGCGYLLRIKGEQPTLLAEMKRLLLPRAGQPEAVSPWESVKGRQLQHRLVRRREIAGFDDWAHSRQAWLVQTVVRHKDGHEEVVMERYYLTNLSWNALSAKQILHVVRGHWSIENDCNWVLDVAWEEDTTAWATNAGQVATHHPLRTLSWLRMLAYNVLGWLLRVRLRSRPTWSALRDALRRVLLPIPSATEMELELLPLG